MIEVSSTWIDGARFHVDYRKPKGPAPDDRAPIHIRSSLYETPKGRQRQTMIELRSIWVRPARADYWLGGTRKSENHFILMFGYKHNLPTSNTASSISGGLGDPDRKIPHKEFGHMRNFHKGAFNPPL